MSLTALGLPVSFDTEYSQKIRLAYYNTGSPKYIHLLATIKALVETTQPGPVQAMIISVTRRLHDLFGSLEGVRKRGVVSTEIHTRCRERFREFEKIRADRGFLLYNHPEIRFKYSCLLDRQRADRRRNAKILALRLAQKSRLQVRGTFAWNKMFRRSMKSKRQ